VVTILFSFSALLFCHSLLVLMVIITWPLSQWVLCSLCSSSSYSSVAVAWQGSGGRVAKCIVSLISEKMLDFTLKKKTWILKLQRDHISHPSTRQSPKPEEIWGCKKPGIFHFTGGNAKWHQSCGEEFANIQQKSYSFTLWHSNSISRPPSRRHTSKNVKNICICTRLYKAALFAIAKEWKQHKCLAIGVWLNKLG
jgi:hypothetical protein